MLIWQHCFGGMRFYSAEFRPLLHGLHVLPYCSFFMQCLAARPPAVAFRPPSPPPPQAHLLPPPALLPSLPTECLPPTALRSTSVASAPRRPRTPLRKNTTIRLRRSLTIARLRSPARTTKRTTKAPVGTLGYVGQISLELVSLVQHEI